MLARLSGMRTIAGSWNVHFETFGSSASGDKNALLLDIEALDALVYLLPGYGSAITPIYKNLQNMIKNDFEHVAQVLFESEQYVNGTRDEVSDNREGVDCPLNLGVNLVDNTIPSSQPRPRKRRRSLSSNGTLCILTGSNPLIPTIIVTPCGPQRVEASCHVPFQNSAFGKQLTVAGHPLFNHFFPPLAPAPYILPIVQDWAWQEGHWQARLPSLTDQEKEGVYSRLLARKKLRRPRDQT